MPENKQKPDFRTKAERIVYIKCYIRKLQETQEPWLQEIVETCVEALEKRIAEIHNEANN